MLTLTESAKGLLKEIVNTQSDDPETCVRLIVNSSQQLSLVLSKAEPNDQVVEYQGVNVLLVEPLLAAELKEVTLDVDQKDNESKFVIMKNS